MDTPEPSQEQGLLSVGENGTGAGREHVLLLDNSLRVQAASESFYTAFQIAPGQTTGKRLDELDNGRWNIPALMTRLQELPETRGEFNKLEIEQHLPALATRKVLLSARRMLGQGAQSGMILLSIQEGTGQEPVNGNGGGLLGYRATLASIGYAVVVSNLEGNVTFMNAAAEKLTGWSRNNVLQKRVTDIFNTVNERPGQADQRPVERAILEGAVVDLTSHTVLISRDGSEWPIDGKAAPVRDADGRVAGVVLVFEDVSNLRQSADELKISEVRYRRLFETAHDGILILDAVSTKVLEANPFVADLLGQTREHFLGKELWEIGVFQDAEMSKKAMVALQRDGRIRYEDLPLQHKDGRHIQVEFISNVYREGRRNVIQCNIRDVTEGKRLSRELALASQDAEAANRSKSEFLANMSHEIRTPLGAILGFAEMLLTKSPEECALVGCAQIIRRNSLHLLELINEILDLSKVEAGQMKVERVSCDLPELLSEVAALMRPRAKEKGLAFEVAFQGPIPRLIYTDPMRLRQILVNLLGNALKFTESGKIAIKIADEGTGGPRILLRIEVADSGIGMTPEQLGRLFQPFTQGDASTTRKFGGTGLGLTISRQLARILGGDITATSQAGIGSSFVVKTDGGTSAGVELLQGLTDTTLIAREERKIEDHTRLCGHILLVEDGADNQRLLRMQLGDAGASVTSAMDGRTAVDLAAKQPFDLILMDMQMPVLDGYAATQELRRRGLTLPIIALTAHAMGEDREKCMASGCTGYLSKPVDEETLLITVQECLRSRAPSAPTDSAQAGFPRVPAASIPTGASDADAGTIHCSQIDNPRIMEIVPGFVAALPAKVRKMIDVLEREDLGALQQIAHQLSGSCGGYGFGAVTQPARTVDQSIKEGKPLESITAEVKTLIEVIRRIDGYDGSKELAPGVVANVLLPAG
jgi:PAS domain S-box-containing protein